MGDLHVNIASKLTISTHSAAHFVIYFNISIASDNNNFLVQYRNIIIIEKMPTQKLIVLHIL